MTRPPLALLAAAAALAITAPVAAAAAAADVLPDDVKALPRAGAVANGTATIALNGGASSKLKKAKGSLKASGSGSVKGSTVRLDLAKGGAIDPTLMSGSVIAGGSFSIKGPKGTAKLTAVTFNPGLQKTVTAKLGKTVLTLGSLKGGKATFSGQADGVLTRASLSLSSSAAKKISAKTGGGVAKGSFAKVAIKVTNKELPLKDGVGSMTIDPTLLKTLNDNGADLVATAPATRDGNVVSLQLTGGAFDPFGKTGRLALSGQLAVASAGKSVPLTDWSAAIYAGQSDFFTHINTSVAVVLANVDVSGLTSQITGNTFSATGAKLTLSKIASDTVHQEFGITLAPGTPMGTVDVRGTLSGS